MANDYSFIGEYTKEILVDGKNQLKVFVSHLNLTDYETELYIEFKGRTIYEYSPTSAYCLYFDIPVNWLNQIPDDPLGVGYIKLRTYSKSLELLHEDVKPFTVYVPEEFKPEISFFDVKMIDNYEYVDYAVYGLTKPEVRAMVKAHSTSPIKKYYITGGGINVSGGFQYSSGYADYNFWAEGTVVKTWANTTFTLTVEDGRGRKASVESDSFYIHPYTRPSINSFTAYRTDKDGITKADGDHIKVQIDAAFSPIRDSAGNEINSIKHYVDWKTVNGNYTNFQEIEKGAPFIFEADKDLNYEIKCVVRDKYRETEAYCNVMGDMKDFNICDGGGGAAIGQKAEKGYFDVAYNSRFQKKVTAKEEITSNKGLVSTGTGSKGDFLSFGEATRIESMWHYVGGDPANGVVIELWGDFNDCTNIGVYCVHYNDDVLASNRYCILNAPCEKAGTLRVFNATGNGNVTATEKYLMQEYVVYDGSAVYRRCLSKVRANKDVDWPSEWTYGSWYCYAPGEDFIIQRGTDGMWTWEKWASGKAVCWGKTEKAQYNANSSYGSGFYVDTPDIGWVNGLFTEAPVVSCLFETGNYGVPLISINLTSAWGISPVIYSPVATTFEGSFHINAKGKWK